MIPNLCNLCTAHAAGSPVVCAPLPPGTAGPGKLRKFWCQFCAAFASCRFCAPHCRDKLPNLPNQAPALTKCDMLGFWSGMKNHETSVDEKRWICFDMFWLFLEQVSNVVALSLHCPQTSAICQLSPDCIFEKIELRHVRSAFVEFVHCIDWCVDVWSVKDQMLIRWKTH